MLVSAGPFKYYTNPLFPVKLSLLALALVSQWWLHRRLARSTAIDNPTRWLGLI